MLPREMEPGGHGNKAQSGFFQGLFRLFQIACTGNLMLAIFCAFMYAVYSELAGLPLHERFLGLKPAAQELPQRSWMFVLLLELLIVAVFLFLRGSKNLLRGQRLLCAVVGTMGVWLVLQPVLQIMPPVSPDGEILPRPALGTVLTSDGMLGLYVWCSHLAYAIVGWHEE